MSPLEKHRDAILDAFRGSRLKQAIIGYVTLAGMFSEDGYVPIADVKETLGISDEVWDREYPKLYEDVDLWRDWSGERVVTGIVHDMAKYATGAAGRPNEKTWARLRRRVFAECFGDDTPYCPACKARDVPMAVDHTVPVSRGGSNHILNLIPLCVACNSSKGTKTWEEWHEHRKGWPR